MAANNTTALEFPDEAVDAVIDKGTLDSILCGEVPPVMSKHSLKSRESKTKWRSLMLSYGIPDNRLSYLDNDAYHWSVQVHTVPKPTVASAAQGASDANCALRAMSAQKVILKAKYSLSSCIACSESNSV